jgi:hypothetical protein
MPHLNAYCAAAGVASTALATAAALPLHGAAALATWLAVLVTTCVAAGIAYGPPRTTPQAPRGHDPQGDRHGARHGL